MAFQVTIKDEKRELPYENAYINIRSVRGDKTVLHVTFDVYDSEELSKKGDENILMQINRSIKIMDKKEYDIKVLVEDEKMNLLETELSKLNIDEENATEEQKNKLKELNEAINTCKANKAEYIRLNDNYNNHINPLLEYLYTEAKNEDIFKNAKDV